jgi:3,4-dihydroxy 2-butanone 4-phosphate synthase/GTP cyclohydrolase II
MLSSIEKAIEDLKQGKMIIIVDDEDRENEGDLAFAADKVTPEMINFMSIHGKGLICVPMLGSRLDELDITSMVSDNTSSHSTAFTISVDAIKGATTGISADDRSNTIKMLTSETTLPEDLARPGHIFPLRYAEGGVIERNGQTESIVDLCILSDLYPAGVICEIINDDGTMARRDDLIKFSDKHNINIVSVEDIIKYRKSNNLIDITPDEPKETFIRKNAEYSSLPTSFGAFNIKTYKSYPDGVEHVVLQKGKLNKNTKTPIVRVHSECLTGEVFKSSRCDCGEQLEMALQKISECEYGLLIYLRQEGRGIGFTNKLKAYSLQDQGLDTVDANLHLGYAADPRNFSVASEILRDLNVSKIELMTNNPKKIQELEQAGIEIETIIPIQAEPKDENLEYLKTKKNRMGHLLNLTEFKNLSE